LLFGGRPFFRSHGKGNQKQFMIKVEDNSCAIVRIKLYIPKTM